ncbi:hypothetical protein ACWEGQ_04465 [Streptomyces seoulensis]
MSVTAMLVLSVVVLAAVFGLALVVGLGYAVHRRPALAEPVTVALTAAGVLGAFVFGIVQAVTS